MERKQSKGFTIKGPAIHPWIYLVATFVLLFLKVIGCSFSWWYLLAPLMVMFIFIIGEYLFITILGIILYYIRQKDRE